MHALPRLLLLGLALVLTAAAQTAPAPVPDPSVGVTKRGNARFYELHAQHLKRAKEPMQLLFIGDSITEGWTKAPDVWAEHYAPYQAANFGIGGDQTQHVIWRIEDGVLDGVKPKVVVLMLGTNNSGRNTGEQIAAANAKIVSLIRAKIPEAKVLVLAIFPRGPRKNRDGTPEDHAGRMQEIAKANTLLAQMADGQQVHFLDINSAFLDAAGRIPDSIMPDQLHPNVEGYRRWAAAMRPKLDELMK